MMTNSNIIYKMVQDYKLQYENLLHFKRYLKTLIEALNDMAKSYANAIESSHQNGLTIQMYERIKGLNMGYVSSGFKNLTDVIETDDLAWIQSLEDGMETVLNTAASNASSTSTASVASLSIVEPSSKAEKFKRGIQKIEEKMAILAASDSGREENQRNIHADYLAAFMARQKSR